MDDTLAGIGGFAQGLAGGFQQGLTIRSARERREADAAERRRKRELAAAESMQRAVESGNRTDWAIARPQVEALMNEEEGANLLPILDAMVNEKDEARRQYNSNLVETGIEMGLPAGSAIQMVQDSPEILEKIYVDFRINQEQSGDQADNARQLDLMDAKGVSEEILIETAINKMDENTDPTGRVIDPKLHQFLAGRIGQYQERLSKRQQKEAQAEQAATDSAAITLFARPGSTAGEAIIVAQEQTGGRVSPAVAKQLYQMQRQRDLGANPETNIAIDLRDEGRSALVEASAEGEAARLQASVERLPKLHAARNSLAVAGATMDQVSTGFLGDGRLALAKFFEFFGLQAASDTLIGSADDAELLRSTIPRLVLSLALSAKGVDSAAEMKLLSEAFFSLSTTPEGNQKILRALTEFADHEIAIAELNREAQRHYAAGDLEAGRAAADEAIFLSQQPALSPALMQELREAPTGDATPITAEGIREFGATHHSTILQEANKRAAQGMSPANIRRGVTNLYIDRKYTGDDLNKAVNDVMQAISRESVR